MSYYFVDLIASMRAIENPSLGEIAVQVQEKMKKVVENI